MPILLFLGTLKVGGSFFCLPAQWDQLFKDDTNFIVNGDTNFIVKGDINFIVKGGIYLIVIGNINCTVIVSLKTLTLL